MRSFHATKEDGCGSRCEFHGFVVDQVEVCISLIGFISNCLHLQLINAHRMEAFPLFVCQNCNHKLH